MFRVAATLFIIWIEIILSTKSIHLMNALIPQNLTLSLKRKPHYLQSQNMNITKIIFSALHLYAINH